MADHVRKQIRDAAIAALGNLTTTGSRCYPNRTRRLADNELPALRVYVNNEASSRKSIAGAAGGVLERLAELLVEGCCKADTEDALDDTFDAIAKEVETALGAGLAPAKELTLSSVTTEIEGEGEKARAVISMTFTALYYTTTGAPDVAL